MTSGSRRHKGLESVPSVILLSRQYERTIRDLPILGKEVYLHLQERRFHCLNCDSHFNEGFESVDIKQRQTKRFQEWIGREVRDSTISSASERCGIGIVLLNAYTITPLEFPMRGSFPRELG
ncbi:MAG: transposase family protein [bacterium]